MYMVLTIFRSVYIPYDFALSHLNVTLPYHNCFKTKAGNLHTRIRRSIPKLFTTNKSETGRICQRGCRFSRGGCITSIEGFRASHCSSQNFVNLKPLNAISSLWVVKFDLAVLGVYAFFLMDHGYDPPNFNTWPV